jgi:hypothetical protein
MSAETYAALDAAVTAHVIDEALEQADLIRDWVLVASTSSLEDTEDVQEISVYRSSSTALYAVTGLLDWGRSAYGEVER